MEAVVFKLRWSTICNTRAATAKLMIMIHHAYFDYTHTLTSQENTVPLKSKLPVPSCFLKNRVARYKNGVYVYTVCVVGWLQAKRLHSTQSTQCLTTAYFVHNYDQLP